MALPTALAALVTGHLRTLKTQPKPDTGNVLPLPEQSSSRASHVQQDWPGFPRPLFTKARPHSFVVLHEGAAPTPDGHRLCFMPRTSDGTVGSSLRRRWPTDLFCTAIRICLPILSSRSEDVPTFHFCAKPQKQAQAEAWSPAKLS